MKIIEFNRLQNSRNNKIEKRSSQNIRVHPVMEKSATLIPIHALLKNELKLYRGSSKSKRLGVLRKYDELIAMARKN